MKEKSVLTFLNNFESAMIGEYQIKKNKIFIQLKKEKPTIGYKNKKFDYNLHFHFGLYNQSNTKNIYHIFIECHNKNNLRHRLPWLWISSNVDREYKLVRNIDGKTNFHGKYYFKIHLDPKQKLYLANFPPIRYSILKKTFQDLSEKSDAREITIGKTVEHRRIIAYEYGNIKDKPTILFVAGFHPPERDTIAIEAIMEKFFNEKWKKEILGEYSFSLIPILNPDGFANAMQGSNINEINFHWKFFGNPKDKCPETHSIWEYCLRIKPIVFFDFHAFTFQNNEARPYWIPKGYYVSKKAKLIQNDLNKEFRELCDGNFSIGEAIFAPNLLSTGLRNKIGTITLPKFHLHMKNGIHKSKKMAIRCLDIILITLRYYRINSSVEILKKPYGEIESHIHDEIRIKILNFWYFRLKSFLKHFMRK